MITHVAIKYNGTIYSLPAPNRHHDVIRSIGGIKGPDVQGFLDDKRHFLNRVQALIHAKHYGQLKRRPGQYDGDLLFSEDLW